jgi:type I restriction enzyme S subunit
MNCELKHQQPTLKYGIPEDWHLVKLSDLGEVNRGRSRHRPRYAEHLYGGPYPFIQTGDIKASNGRIREYKQTYCEAGLAQSRLWPAEVMCITIVGANIAETAILRFPACFPDSVIGFIADKSKCDIYFVEYMFRYLKGKVKGEAIGSARDNINLGTFERILFPLPPLIEQKAISQLLNKLDNKIEINDEINKNLEAIGQAVFKRWFIDFEFPNEEGKPYKSSDGEMEKSEMGEIPKGGCSEKLVKY